MQASANRPISPIPLRAPWPESFPLADIHAPESSVKKHPAYAAAKSGDAGASLELVQSLANDALIESLHAYRKQSPLLLPVHGIEGTSVNTIPLALAVHLSEQLGYDIALDVIQASKAGHTGSSGWWRLVSPALFSGQITPGTAYILLDDFIGMGGTFANLRGYIEAKGGVVVHAQALTGKPHSSKLSLQHDTLEALRERYGHEFETWWIV
jgi:hypoxanthine-guanine phosphoribosyltransferase